MNDLISKLSEIRSEYNCFNQDEEPYYRALSEVISILSQHKDGDTISRKSAIDALKKAYWDKDLQAVKDDPCVIDAMTDWSIQQIKALPSVDTEQVWLDSPITSTEFITHCHSNGYELHFRTDDRKKYEAVQEECRRQIGHVKPSADVKLSFEVQDILDYLDTVLHPIISPEHWNVYSELHDMISTLPFTERHGRWIPVDSYSAFGVDEATWMAHGNPIAFYYCSECKEQTYAGEDGESLITDYCPYCGAKMNEV